MAQRIGTELQKKGTFLFKVSYVFIKEGNQIIWNQK